MLYFYDSIVRKEGYCLGFSDWGEEFTKLVPELDLFNESKRKTQKVSGLAEVMTIDSVTDLGGDKYDAMIKTPFGLTSISSLSKGCKAALIIDHYCKYHNNKPLIVNGDGLGSNIIRVIARLSSKYPNVEIQVQIGYNCFLPEPSPFSLERKLREVPVKYSYNSSSVFNNLESLSDSIMFNYLSRMKPNSTLLDLKPFKDYCYALLQCDKKYESPLVKPAFDKLSLTLKNFKLDLEFPYEQTVLVGESGIGKSLITRVIKGFSDSLTQKFWRKTQSMEGAILCFDSSNPLSVQKLAELNQKHDIANSCIFLDDCEKFLTAELSERLWKSNAQIVYFGSGSWLRDLNIELLNIGSLRFDGESLRTFYPKSWVNESEFAFIQSLVNKPSWASTERDSKAKESGLDFLHLNTDLFG